MGQEIEAKFAVVGDGWRGAGRAVEIIQGYLSTVPERTVRARVKKPLGEGSEKAFLTIKGLPGDDGLTRREFEYAIPPEDAREMLAELCEGSAIEKTRHVVEHEGATWEVDDFAGVNAGLVVAELEAESVEALEQVLGEHRPPWIGEQLSDPRYTNAELARRPFSRWSAEERAPHARRSGEGG